MSKSGGGLLGRASPSKVSPRNEEQPDAFTQGPEQLVGMLEVQLANENWGAIMHLMHLSSFMARCKPFMATQLASNGGAKVLLAIMKTIVGGDEGPAATEVLLSTAMELMLQLIKADDAVCADALLSPNGVAILLVLLGSPASGSQVRQQVAFLLRHYVNAGAGFRERLLAHGALHALPLVLHDPVAGCDLLFVQDVLWCLVGLMDAEVALHGRLDCLGPLTATLVPLLQLLAMPENASMGHILALVTRALHVMIAGEDYGKEQLRKLGVVNLLVDVVREERADMAPHGTTDDSSPRKATGTYSSSSRNGSVSGSSPGRVHAHGRASVGNGNYPGSDLNAWQRFTMTLLIRAILGKEAHSPLSGSPTAIQSDSGLTCGAASPVHMSASSVVSYGLLLPLLEDDHTPANRRLCPVKEAVAALKTMLCDSPANQEQAVACGVVPVLVQLVATGDMELAWQAVDALGYLSGPTHRAHLLANHAVEEITFLMQEAANALHELTVRKQLEEHSLKGEVHHIPAPHSAYAHQGRHSKSAPRVHLVGRQRLNFYRSSCMYATHDANAMCDYCVPSACLRALLKLMDFAPEQDLTATTPAGADGEPSTSSSLPRASTSGLTTTLANPSSSSWWGAQRPQRNAAVPGRFVASGGLYTLFLLLHHELSGVHHSKMASSLVSLVNIVLDAGLGLQDQVRKVGGLAILVAMVHSLASSQGVTDIYQLRVQVCVALQRVLEGNQANKLLVRELDLLKPMVAVLKTATDAQQADVLDDMEQVLVSALDVLSSCLVDSRGNQEALVAAGGLRLLHDLAMKDKASPAVLAAAVRAYGFLAEGCEAAQLTLLSANTLARLVTLAEQAPASPLSQCVVYTCCQLMRSNPQGKPKAVGAGLLPLLLKMLEVTPTGHHTAAACQGLYAIAVQDIDLQNEVAAQGGLHTVQQLIEGRSHLTTHALWLLCSLLHGNSYVKNAARQHGLAALLLTMVREGGVARPDISVAAAHALAQLCQSNHGNQEAAADDGGIEVATDLLRGIVGHGAQENQEDGLVLAKSQPALLDAALRMLGALVEFNATNQRLVRESGCLASVAELLLLAGKVTDLGSLTRGRLLPALAAACVVVAVSAQDCAENQTRLMTDHEDLAPALFRLLAIEDRVVVMEAARALEYVAIRTELVHDRSEARSEFEADAIRTLVRILHSRNSGAAPTASAASTAAGLQGSGSVVAEALGGMPGAHAPQVSAATVKEAANILSAIVVAAALPAATSSVQGSAGSTASKGGSVRGGSSQELTQGPPAGVLPGPDSTQGSATFTGAAENPLAQLALMRPLAGDFAAAGQEAGVRVLPSSARGGDAGVLVVDHSSGIATNAALQGTSPLSSAHWTNLAGQYAAAFKAVAKEVGEGPWRAVKVQLAWLLFLLAAKSPANRELITKLERTIVSPLANQLANAERFYASAVAVAALAESEDQAVAPLPISTLANDHSLQLQSSGSNPKPGSLPTSGWPSNQATGNNSVAASAAATPRPASPALGPPSITASPALQRGGAGVGGDHGGAYASPGGPGVMLPAALVGSPMTPTTHAKTTSDDEDDLAMIRQEVAMLSMLGTPRN